MQTYSETDLLTRYKPFILKHAKRLYYKYRAATPISGLEDYVQEAELGFLRALRITKAETYPLPALTIGYAKNRIFENIYRNLVVNGDGIHRPGDRMSRGYQQTTCYTAENIFDSFEDKSMITLFEDAGFKADICRMPKNHQFVIHALVNGMSRREIVRGSGMSRRRVDHCIDDLRASYSIEGERA